MTSKITAAIKPDTIWNAPLVVAPNTPQEGVEIKTGIYRGDNGEWCQVIGIATHRELFRSVVVYRELFGEYKLLVMPVETFQAMLGTNITLVKKL